MSDQETESEDDGALSMIVNFATIEDLSAFAKLIRQPVTVLTDEIWFPKVDLHQ